MTTFAMPQPNPLMRALLLATASRDATVELTPTTLTVRLGLTWRATIPRDQIVRADHADGRSVSIGAHGWGGRWRVNTTNRGLVRLDVEPEASARLFGVPVRLTELVVSVEDPDGLLQELGVNANA